MGIRRIVLQGDPLLYKPCRVIKDFNPRLHQLLDDMRDTLSQAQGAGLAAPQVGVLRRAILVAEDGDGEFMEYVNPEILYREGEQDGPEGCLSVPGKWGMVTRPEKIRIRAQDRFGAVFEREAEDLTARCLCHEIEHLDGHLYTEHIDRFMTDEEVEAYFEEAGS